MLPHDSLGNTVSAPPPAREPQTHFHELPDELLVYIFSLLTPADLGVVRSVCRRWNTAVLDKTPWISAFNARFHTGNVFASVTRSESWLPEYYGRASVLRKWKKAKAFSLSYPLMNSDFGRVDLVDTDFVADRLLTFCSLSGSVSLCTLTSGKNQVFIPESQHFAELRAYDCCSNYLCVANTRGELYVKNLITATSTGSTSWSTKKLHQSRLPIVAVRINRVCDKHKAKPDIVSATSAGKICFWNLAGSMITAVDIGDQVCFLDTDFRTMVVVVTETRMHILSFVTKKPVFSFFHGWKLTSKPVACHVDFFDGNIVLGYDNMLRVFHIDGSSHSMSESPIPEFVTIIDGTMQPCYHARNPDVAGSDGLLYALTFSDGSVGVYNIRDLDATFSMKTRILPFEDDRTPTGIAHFTKVALNSAVIAIGALSDWIHIYDAHSGEYLREGTKVSSKLTRHGSMPISSIQFAPTGAAGVVVSGDVVQYFTYGHEQAKKKPVSRETYIGSAKKEKERKIKVQLEDYDVQQHQKAQQELLLDKYNGTTFESEQDELRMAMAMSASFSHDDELQHVLAQSKEDVNSVPSSENEDIELLQAIAQSEKESHSRIHGLTEEPQGSSREQETFTNHSSEDANQNEEDEEILRRVIELSMIEH